MWVLGALVVCALAQQFIAPPPPPYLDVWPLPAEYEIGSETITVADGLQITSSGNVGVDIGVVNRAITRYRTLMMPLSSVEGVAAGWLPYQKNIFLARGPPSSSPSTSLSASESSSVSESNSPTLPPAPAGQRKNVVDLGTLTITVLGEADEPLQFGMNESYYLAVFTNGTATITAQSVWGALRGIETFSQLVMWDGAKYTIRYCPIIVTDKPRFPWRGILVDTARHYFPVATLQRVIDGMAYNKLNTFHWHIVDAESFPFQSATYPALSAMGSYGPGKIYTHADVTTLVAYAKDRGVRIVPEFDVPGHTASWGQGVPGIITQCWDWLAQPRQHMNYNNVAMDPTVELTYDVITNLFRELAPLFPDKFFHAGGDELNTGCWNASESIREYMRNNNLAVNGTYNFLGLQNIFEQRIQDIVEANDKTTVLWDEAFAEGFELLPDTVTHVWRDSIFLQQVLDASRPAVASFGWYLDRQAPTCNTTLCQTAWMWIHTWQDMYNVQLPDSPFLYGGEACSWSENVNPFTIDERLWSRGPAVSERLWSPASSTTSSAAAQTRLASFGCKLNRRGIGNSPTVPDFCDVLPSSVPSPTPSPTDSPSPAPAPATIAVSRAWVLATGVLASFMAAVLFILMILLINWIKKRRAEGRGYSPFA